MAESSLCEPVDPKTLLAPTPTPPELPTPPTLPLPPAPLASLLGFQEQDLDNMNCDWQQILEMYVEQPRPNTLPLPPSNRDFILRREAAPEM